MQAACFLPLQSKTRMTGVSGKRYCPRTLDTRTFSPDTWAALMNCTLEFSLDGEARPAGIVVGSVRFTEVVMAVVVMSSVLFDVFVLVSTLSTGCGVLRSSVCNPSTSAGVPRLHRHGYCA